MTNNAQILEQKALHRRRWSIVILTYGLLMIIATVLMGTFAVGALASLKENPLERPFRLWFEQIKPHNWTSAYTLGRMGSQNGLWGGFAPNGQIVFDFSYAVEGDYDGTEPEIVVPKRKPGTGMAAAVYTDFASDYVSDLQVEKIEQFERMIEGQNYTVIQWRIRMAYSGDGPRIERLPLDITMPREFQLIDSSLTPTRFERRGRVASWSNITPGVLGYVFNNYRRVIKESVNLNTGESLFLKWTFNSFVIAIGKVIVTLAMATTAGYALARMQFPGSRVLFYVLLLSMMIPGQVTFISNYLVMRDLSLLNTPWALILMTVTSAQVLMMKQYFDNIPRDVEEAALMDGAGYWLTFFKVILPMSKPALVTVTILAFQGAWNDFFWPLVLITSPSDAFTLPVGLLSLRNSYGQTGDWGLILAGAFMSTLPIILLFIFFQRFIVENPISSGSKG
jgi:multiple sugar transport system permease protein